MTVDTDWCSLIRQKVNNIYTRYFDKEVILKKDYMDLLKTPKRLYYQWVDGIEMNPIELTTIIYNAIDNAQQLKEVYQKQKMDLTWSEYKKIIEVFLKKCLDNCKFIEDYELESKYNVFYDFINEDNFYIRYFCRSIELSMLNYQKNYYKLKRGRDKKFIYCKGCGILIEKTGNKKLYCDSCAIQRKKASNKLSDKKYKNKIRENKKY